MLQEVISEVGVLHAILHANNLDITFNANILTDLHSLLYNVSSPCILLLNAFQSKVRSFLPLKAKSWVRDITFGYSVVSLFFQVFWFGLFFPQQYGGKR